jgi:hypothetical protein
MGNGVKMTEEYEDFKARVDKHKKHEGIKVEKSTCFCFMNNIRQYQAFLQKNEIGMDRREFIYVKLERDSVARKIRGHRNSKYVISEEASLSNFCDNVIIETFKDVSDKFIIP